MHNTLKVFLTPILYNLKGAHFRSGLVHFRLGQVHFTRSLSDRASGLKVNVEH